MSEEIISKKTRTEFRNFLAEWTLQEITDEFEAAGIERDKEYEPDLSGARKSLVEQHYHSLDMTEPSDVRKLLSAYEGILNGALQIAERDDPSEESDRLRQNVESLAKHLRRDGFEYRNGRATPVSPKAQQAISGSRTADTISELTRRDICDFIRTNNVNWAGRLSEADFLDRLYRLSDLPSFDPRFEDLAGDLWQHRVNNNDWDDDWVLTDPRLGLESGSDEMLLAFLAEMLHPVVRRFDDEARRMLETFNGYLEPDGWEIAERERVSGRPVFAARRLLPGALQALDAAKSDSTGTAQEAPAARATGTHPPVSDDIPETKGRLDELAAGAAKTSDGPARRGSRGEKVLAGLVISSNGGDSASLANSHGETVSTKLLIGLGIAFFVGSITCLVPGIGHLGEDRPRPGWTLLAGAWVLATIGFRLLSELHTPWRRARVRIVLSLVVAGFFFLLGTLAGEPRDVPAAPSAAPGGRHVTDAAAVPDPVGTESSANPLEAEPVKPEPKAPVGEPEQPPFPAPVIGPGATVSQESSGDNSPNVIAGGDVTVNPPADPNAPSVYYLPNGMTRTQIGGTITLGDGRVTASQRMLSLNESGSWEKLAGLCEEEIKATPDWLTPYFFAGVAHANLGELATARNRLEEFERRARGNPDYAKLHTQSLTALAWATQRETGPASFGGSSP